MKTTRYAFTGLVLFILSGNLFSQEFDGAQMSFIVSNAAGRTQTLFLGIETRATTGIDPSIGEAEIPPLPPAEIFDARIISTPGKSQLGLGVYRDFRPIASSTSQFTETYTIAFQGGINTTSVKIAWATPYPFRITKIMIDGADMSGKTEINSPLGTGQASVQITYNYRPFSLTANPTALSFAASNRGALPTKTLDIIPDGDVSALWALTSDAEWLDVFPASGAGRKTVEVSIITQVLPAGIYNGVIHASALAYPGVVDIPITLTMTVGVNDQVSSPTSVKLHQNFPNPISARLDGISITRISFNLGDRTRLHAQPTLKLYDIFGREVADLSSQIIDQPDLQFISFDASRLSSGIYTYRLHDGSTTLSRKMIVAR